MISVLQSTAPSLLLSSDKSASNSNIQTNQSREASHIKSNHTLITAATQDEEFAMNARSFLIESTKGLASLQREGSQRITDLDSALSDETARPTSNDQRLRASLTSTISTKASESFSNQAVRPPTLLESALNDSFFEKVKREQEKGAVKPDDEELNIPELVIIVALVYSSRFLLPISYMFFCRFMKLHLNSLGCYLLNCSNLQSWE